MKLSIRKFTNEVYDPILHDITTIESETLPEIGSIMYITDVPYKVINRVYRTDITEQEIEEAAIYVELFKEEE